MTVADLDYDVWQIILDLLDSRNCQTQKDFLLRKQKPLKALNLVNCKITSIVRPRLFTGLSVVSPYTFAVTFLAGEKPKPTEFPKYARRLDIDSTNDISGSKKLLAGYEVFSKFLSKLTEPHTLHITMMPCFELTSRLSNQKQRCRLPA